MCECVCLSLSVSLLTAARMLHRVAVRNLVELQQDHTGTLFEIPLLKSKQQLSDYYLYHTSMFLIIIVALLACQYLIFLLVTASSF